MALKPWHTIITPREDLRENKPLDAAEFAVHLDKVRDGSAPTVYKNPKAFFERTFLTANLSALAAEVARRLSGLQTETSAVFNLATQFGGGKTHALTLLYHLASHGVTQTSDWPGVHTILARAGITQVPQSAVAVFVGTEFDSLSGRGGADGTPLRRTPWGEIAYQLGGDAGFSRVAEHEQQGIAPGGDTIRDMLPTDRPCLILMDELLNYISRSRKSGLAAQFYDFLHNLSETARSMTNVVLVVSIPASELEMTPEDHSDYERIRKLLDRVGKAYILSSETETSEIIRRRLFEWDLRALGQNGRVSLPAEARATCEEYALWTLDHRQQLPQWFPLDHAAEAFMATYPFHPSVLSVFERKWRSLPRFQQTRGVLRMLALWIAHAYSDNYRRAHRDPLIGLGTAPLDDALFRAALFEQLGESRLEAVITTDICGKPESHATRLDAEAADVFRRARLHRKVATSIFFESHGGGAASKAFATVPEIRLAVAEPDLDVGNVETALDALSTSCYYLTADANQYRFGVSANLNKLLADRRATIQHAAIEQRVRDEVEQVFRAGSGIERVFFPERSNDIPDRPALTLAVLAPDVIWHEGNETHQQVAAMTREYGTSSRQFKNAVLWCVPESASGMFEEARKVLAWESIRHDTDLLKDVEEVQKRHLDENLMRARRDLQASVWRSYRRLVLLSKDNTLTSLDLGQMNSSGGALVTQILQQLQQRDELTAAVGAGFLVRNWPPAFTEWSTRSVRDAFYASPRFPRLMRADIVRETIARGVSEGVLAYVGKGSAGEYIPMHYKQMLNPTDIDLSDDMYLITSTTADAYLQQMTQRPSQESTQVATPADTAQAASATLFTYPTSSTPDGRVNEPAVGGAVAMADVSQNGGTTAGVASRLRWTGQIAPQKWTMFYTKVLSGLVSSGDVQLTVTVEAMPKNGLTPQRIETVKAALRELGLQDDMSVE